MNFFKKWNGTFKFMAISIIFNNRNYFILLFILLFIPFSALEGKEINIDELRKELEKAGYTPEEVAEIVKKQKQKRELKTDDALPKEVSVAVDLIEKSIQKEIDGLSKAIQAIKEKTINDLKSVQVSILRSVTKTSLDESIKTALIIGKHIKEYQDKDIKSCLLSKQTDDKKVIDKIKYIVKKFDKEIDEQKNESFKEFEKVKSKSLEKLLSLQKKNVQKGDLEEAIAIKKVVEFYKNITLESYVTTPKIRLKEEKKDKDQGKDQDQEHSEASPNLKIALLKQKGREGDLENPGSTRTLKLHDSNLKDDDVRFIVKHFKVLSHLILIRNKDISDMSLKWIKDLHGLHSLGVEGTNITAKGIYTHLKGMEHLETIYVGRDQFNDEELKLIDKAFPKIINFRTR